MNMITNAIAMHYWRQLSQRSSCT